MSKRRKNLAGKVEAKIEAYNGIIDMIDVYNKRKIGYDEFLEEIMPLAKTICNNEDDSRRLVLNIEDFAKCRGKDEDYFLDASQNAGYKIYKMIVSEIVKDQKELIKELNKKN